MRQLVTIADPRRQPGLRPIQVNPIPPNRVGLVKVGPISCI